MRAREEWLDRQLSEFDATGHRTLRAAITLLNRPRGRPATTTTRHRTPEECGAGISAPRANDPLVILQQGAPSGSAVTRRTVASRGTGRVAGPAAPWARTLGTRGVDPDRCHGPVQEITAHFIVGGWC